MLLQYPLGGFFMFLSLLTALIFFKEFLIPIDQYFGRGWNHQPAMGYHGGVHTVQDFGFDPPK